MTLNKLQSYIVFIENEDITRDSSGGVMSYILNLSKYFIENDRKTVLIGCGSLKGTDAQSKIFSEFYSIAKKSSLGNFKFFLKLFTTKTLKKIKKGDIVHVQRPEMVIPLALRKRNKIICTLHGGQDIAVIKKKGKVMGSFYAFLQYFAFKLADRLIAVDQKNLDRYVKKYPWIKHKIELIPISVDTNRFFTKDKAEARTKFNLPQNEKIILFIGRLEYEKNVEFIINSFKQINKSNIKLVIVGSGSLYQDLVKLAETHKQQILFLGELDNSLIPDLINCADAMILASFFEGSPTVVKESLCCGVPVISTDVGDVKEVIKSVEGGEIIDNTVESFLKAVNKLLSKKEYQVKNASTLFSYNLMGEKTLTVYSK
ncbi:glycosyltransferase family 4 protein [Aureibaculum conchae]|uniref:glycosyltransferase family 4 protein n=1 Tax=Aureibaculum sp. 2308TA14-22 TaxID=3108392 RepID=UPI003390EADE